MTQTTTSTTPRLVTCKTFLAGRDWPTETSLRYYIFFNKFGFEERCVRRIGKRVFIDETAFEQWMLEQAR